ncbi:hypothetical protein FRC0182_01991 [Corynebacterium diphtheriae]|nr:hypothetical protein FRC0182_01991 [Corynebacterium diphtheriae]
MGNIIQTFTNDVFGTIRTITTDGQMLFCGEGRRHCARLR